MPKTRVLDETLLAMQQSAQTIFDKKGFNILGLDVRSFSSMTEYYLIAEGTVSRHLNSLYRALIDSLREIGYHALHVEGQKTGDWIVLDYGSFVIHLMQPEVREKYSLEEMWKEGKIVDLNIKVNKEL